MPRHLRSGARNGRRGDSRCLLRSACSGLGLPGRAADRSRGRGSNKRRSRTGNAGPGWTLARRRTGAVRSACGGGCAAAGPRGKSAAPRCAEAKHRLTPPRRYRARTARLAVAPCRRQSGSLPLPENRVKIRFDPEIARPIDHSTIRIRWLDAQTSAQATGSRAVLLREAAGRISVGISHPSPMAKGYEKDHAIGC